MAILSRGGIMSDIMFVIRLEGKIILSATSESESGLLSFRDNRYPGIFHGPARKLVSLFDHDDMDMVSNMVMGDEMTVELSLVEHRRLSLFLHKANIPAITDNCSWWIALEDCTLEDILSETGLTMFAEPFAVANPFADLAPTARS